MSLQKKHKTNNPPPRSPPSPTSLLPGLVAPPPGRSHWEAADNDLRLRSSSSLQNAPAGSLGLGGSLGGAGVFFGFSGRIGQPGGDSFFFFFFFFENKKQKETEGALKGNLDLGSPFSFVFLKIIISLTQMFETL